MNKYLSGLAGKAVVAASVLALLLPGLAHADGHSLKINGATVTQDATVNHATGAATAVTPLTAPLVLSNFDGVATLTLGQSQSLRVVSVPLKMCKPGTGGNLEWLDQGTTAVGVTGVLTSGTTGTVPPNGYRVVLGMTAISDTYAASNGSCTTSGAKTYTYTSTAVVAKRNGGGDSFATKLTTTYNFWNTINSVPEPGTIALMLTALLGLGWINRKQARGVSA